MNCLRLATMLQDPFSTFPTFILHLLLEEFLSSVKNLHFNSPTPLSSSTRCPMIHPTPQSRGRSPAWSPSWCGGCLVERFSCPLWPLDRRSSTTWIASRSQTRSQFHRGPQHCRYAPRHSSPSPQLTPAGRTTWTTCVCPFTTKCLLAEWVIRVGDE